MNKQTFFIVGTTATGKTELAHHLARALGNAEIVSADSMQIYKDMPILTAMPEPDKREEVPYHLIDYVDIHTDYSVADFYDDAQACIEDIHRRKKHPIVVGGSGMYVRTLLRGMFSAPPADNEFREAMHQLVCEQGEMALYNILKRQDPVAAERIDPNNIRRIIRALEVFKLTGQRISELQTEWNKPLRDFHPLLGQLHLYGVCASRPLLYERINQRVDVMVERGLFEEVEHLAERGIMNTKVAQQAIGVKEITQYLEGILSRNTAIELLKRNTRRFAKRQLTWFAREDCFQWLLNNKRTHLTDLVSMIMETI